MSVRDDLIAAKGADMSKTIDLPIPRDYPTRDDEIRKLVETIVSGSIVTRALERFMVQVLTEVHESRIRPLLEALETIASVDDDGFTSDGHERCVETALRAISKAKGRP